MGETTPEVPGIRPESLARRAAALPRTDDTDMLQFQHIMSKKLAAQLDARCKEIGGLSRRALMNVILWEAMNGTHMTKIEETPHE